MYLQALVEEQNMHPPTSKTTLTLTGTIKFTNTPNVTPPVASIVSNHASNIPESAYPLIGASIYSATST